LHHNEERSLQSNRAFTEDHLGDKPMFSLKTLVQTLAVTIVLATGFDHATQAADDTIQIGVPLELSGRFVSFGTSGKRGIEMAVDAFKGRIANKKIDVLFRDVQSDAQVTVQVMNELATQKKVNLLMGPISSAMVSAAIPAWRQTKPIWIAHGSTTPRTEEEVGAEPHFFHTFPYAYHYQAAMAAGLKAELGTGKTAAIIYADDAYGRAGLPAAKKYFTEAGFKIGNEELVRSGAADMNPILQKVRFGNPDVLINLVQTTDLATLAKQIKIAGLATPYLTDGIDVFIEEWQQAVGDAQEGWIGVSGFFPGMTRPASKDQPDIFPSLADWEAKFRARYNTAPGYLDVGAYCAMSMLLLAVDKAGTDDPEKVAAALKSLDVQTLLGHGKFVPTGSGTLNQAFQDLMVVQRHANKNVIVFPADVATGKLVARSVK
jgi:branched-chain amino acid transport system substrate-binding protein